MSATKTRSSQLSRRAERFAAQQAAAKRRRRIVLSAVFGFLLAATAIGVFVGVSGHSSAEGALTPPHVTAAGGIVVGSASAPVHVVAFEDPQCPSCARFEQGNGVLLAAAVRDGKVTVEYRMRSFLGPESVRAVNALAAAQADGGFEPLRELLYANQPVEGTGGYTTEDLLALGEQAGLTSSEYVDAVRGMRYEDWVRSVDDRASRDGNVATPELRIGDRVLTSKQLSDPAAFRAALGLNG